MWRFCFFVNPLFWCLNSFSLSVLPRCHCLLRVQSLRMVWRSGSRSGSAFPLWGPLCLDVLRLRMSTSLVFLDDGWMDMAFMDYCNAATGIANVRITNKAFMKWTAGDAWIVLYLEAGENWRRDLKWGKEILGGGETRWQTIIEWTTDKKALVWHGQV